MKKATKDKISKFLFYSLSEEQTTQLQHMIERKSINFDPPLLKIEGKSDCIKVEIKLIPGSYE